MFINLWEPTWDVFVVAWDQMKRSRFLLISRTRSLSTFLVAATKSTSEIEGIRPVDGLIWHGHLSTRSVAVTFIISSRASRGKRPIWRCCAFLLCYPGWCTTNWPPCLFVCQQQTSQLCTHLPGKRVVTQIHGRPFSSAGHSSEPRGMEADRRAR